MNGIIPTALGIPPRTLGNKLPIYPLLPRNLKMISTIPVPIREKRKTKINAKNIDVYII
jgi:hypothetical protein